MYNFFSPHRHIQRLSRKFSRYLKYWLLMLFVAVLVVSGCQAILRQQEAKVINVTLWQGVNPPQNRDILQKLVDKFNQTHPDIHVESLYVGQQDQQMPKILAAVVGNAPPDLLWYNPTIAGQLVELDAIIPVDEMLKNSAVKAEIDPTLFASMEYQGKIWSIPFATNNVGVFYRPSLFKAAGIENLPRTWEELRQVAQKLTRDTDKDGKIDQYGMLLPLGKGEFTVFTWLPFMWSSGGELVSGDAQQAAAVNLKDNQGAIAALQFWRDLIVDGSAMLSEPERGYEVNNLVSGNVAMQVTGPWSLGEFQQSGVDFDVFPIPINKNPSTSIGGENLFLFKTTPEQQKAAFKFAEYAVSQAFQTELALGTGYLPVNVRSRQSSQYQKFIQKFPQLQVFLDQAKFGRSRPIFPNYTRISDNLGRAIESVLLGKNSPAQALNITQQRLDLIFQ
ncbi:ABC transporter substrate-binding protein [Tolypothrix sp. FACHB-123]|uniref:ABC transporter substrate-binding protein n=1 Tax=Tolypothrix sp. FACHB-123 TaxID=2692868 RepID=UPI001681F455|nr:ABC transporter substrate-binding protein [Tolypothrix sp. FACHB-123]MBD2356224.1 ABC transporter substrate-binding protein [Tolypothrix sp. FACHB-123]